MTKRSDQVQILAFRYADSLSAARLRALVQENHGQRNDFVLDYDELCATALPSLSIFDGQPREHVQGQYVPRRLRFMNVSRLECTGLYTHLDDLPLDHPARSLRGTLYVSPPGKPAMWGVFNGSDEPADLMLSARRYRQEERLGEPEAADLARDWSPPPPLAARQVAVHKRIHEKYGGDPVTVWLDGKAVPRRLFVGGLDCQRDQRPGVEAVLNLGDEPSRWATGQPTSSSDRWARKGEGQSGMGLAEITAEASWGIDRLRAGEQVLVHCSAGFNRSVTICCAALILLEKLTAAAALDRVREHHPWARPDTHHWLALRWLAEMATR